MSIHDIYKTESRRLSKLLDLDKAAKDVWRPEELSDLWQHQLNAPLEVDVSTLGGEAKTRLDTASSTMVSPPRTFAELFHHPHPTVALLRLAHAFGKRNSQGDGNVIPKKTALMIYYASIAGALVRCGDTITTLSRAKLCEGFQWAIAQSWVDDRTRALLREGLKHLTKQRHTAEE
jgi:hypothetical protein